MQYFEPVGGKKRPLLQVYQGPLLENLAVTTDGDTATITIDAATAKLIPASPEGGHEILVHVAGYGFAAHGKVSALEVAATVSDVAVTAGL